MTNSDKSQKIAQIDKGSMKRVLGVSDLFAVGYGDLGSSIYYALGITALFALGATPIALVIAGLVFACTALTYAEMSSVISEAGGSASFSRKAFNDLISFIAGWGLLLDYIVTIAISSYAVSPYLSYFFAALKIVEVKLAVTVLLVFVLTIINTLGSKCSTRLSVVLTFLTVITQVTIIVIGAIFLVDLPLFLSHLKINVPDVSWSPTWPNFLKGVAMAMVAYTGIESMAQLSSEAKNPAKTVPRAIMLAMTLLLLMYIGISIVALSALTPQALSTTFIEDPIAGIVSKLPIGGAFLGPWVGLLGAIILLVAANAGLIGASRLSFNMGEYYQLPRIFYKLHPKYSTPFVSLLFFAAIACVIVIWSGGSLSFLADLYNFGAMLAFFSAHLALIMHRIKYPDMKRPFKIPFNIKIKGQPVPITAILGCVVTFAVWVLVIVTKPDGRWLGTAWMIVGLCMYYYYRRRHKISPTGSVELEKVNMEDFEKIKFKKILVPTRGGAETETVQIACQLAKVYNAEVTAIHVMEMPFAFPLHTEIHKIDKHSISALKRAEAIARDMGVPIHLESIRARSVKRAIIELVHQEGFDLIILGASMPKTQSSHPAKLGAVTDSIMKDAECRVWVCKQS